jgi:PIN domain nuclease of toxin-antitoxin system
MTVPDRPLLLDTVAFIFWHADSPRLSPLARRLLLEAPQRAIYVSAASAYTAIRSIASSARRALSSRARS